ncbi:site-2 protease family protein [bacterium]|nr:site-2 protease family protein [bacterium]
MILSILIIFFSIVGLLILHELGHFLIAKKFGVKVEEFGVGYPPRIFGKKWGETLYSLNLLPFGAFVKIYGEDKNIEELRSFSKKPIWQRALIVAGGVVSFFICGILILTLVAWLGGLPQAIPDNASNVSHPKVEIAQVLPDTPAKKAGLERGDVILGLEVGNLASKVNKMEDVQNFVARNKGKKIILKIQRGNKISNFSLVPRTSPPPGQGAMGIALLRVEQKKYSLPGAFLESCLISGRTTVLVPYFLGKMVWQALIGKPMEGAQLVGPVGIGSVMFSALSHGIWSFLFTLGMIANFLAVSNLLPIPAVDGGKLLFLAIEKIRGKAINPKIEAKVNATFFILLIGLMAFVTIKDIQRLF